jgi:hypothetical protein
MKKLTLIIVVMGCLVGLLNAQSLYEVNIGNQQGFLFADGLLPYTSFNSVSQTIYFANEINTTGHITSIEFNVKTLSGSFPEAVPVKFYMASTNIYGFTGSSFPGYTDSWIPFEQFELVYNGILPLPPFVSNNTVYSVTIQLDTSYNYTGGNLAVMAYQPYTLFDIENEFYWRITAYTYAGYRTKIYCSNQQFDIETEIPQSDQIKASYPNIKLIFNANTDNVDNTGLLVQNALKTNYPNPFNPETTIVFTVGNAFMRSENNVGGTDKSVGGTDKSVPYNVQIDIYNTKGQKVRGLVDGVYGVGTHKVVWNGLDDNGASVSSGIYFYRMRAGDFTETKKMMLMK